MSFKTSFRDSDGNIIKFEYRDSLHSTTRLAREYARSGYPDRYVIYTELQSSSSITKTKLPEGEMEKGIFISCILRPSIFPSQAGILGPLAAVALATALEEHTSKKIGIGWVSDVYCDGVRIGGAAIEGKLDNHSAYEYLIVSFAVKLRAIETSEHISDESLYIPPTSRRIPHARCVFPVPGSPSRMSVLKASAFISRTYSITEFRAAFCSGVSARNVPSDSCQ